jgi:hypothetical protein
VPQAAKCEDVDRRGKKGGEMGCDTERKALVDQDSKQRHARDFERGILWHY